jgi:hypothetical protein
MPCYLANGKLRTLRSVGGIGQVYLPISGGGGPTEATERLAELTQLEELLPVILPIVDEIYFLSSYLQCHPLLIHLFLAFGQLLHLMSLMPARIFLQFHIRTFALFLLLFLDFLPLIFLKHNQHE